jgi:hypothetical protein
MEHLLYGGPFEKAGQQVVSLIITMEMKIHVLVESSDLFAHRLIEEFDAVLVHNRHLEKVKKGKGCCIVLFSLPVDNNKGADEEFS